jgi:hypothetical protein
MPEAPDGRPARPKLAFVYGRTSGPARVCAETQPEVLERLEVTTVPTVLVIEGRKIRARVGGVSARAQLEAALAPWLA